MLYNKEQKYNESSTAELQEDENAKDSGISEEDSDSISKPVNEPKISSIITKQNKSKKAKTHENKNNPTDQPIKSSGRRKKYAQVNENYYNAQRDFTETLLQNTRNTSKVVKECSKESDAVLGGFNELGREIDGAEAATKSVTTAVNNHEKLLKSNYLGLKCKKVIGTTSGIGGAAVMITGATVSNPIVAGIGGIVTLLGVSLAIYSFYNLYKKPNSTIKNIDVELGVQDQSLLQH